ncbi:MAG: hypothetical protein RR397_08460 [Odoribacter sp.]
MVKHGIKILHALVLLMTGVALIGVNVIQLRCAYSDKMHWTVQMLPIEDTCPCDEGCGGCTTEKESKKDCRHNSTHSFYKITDSSQIEQGLQIWIALIYLPFSWQGMFENLSLLPEKHFLFRYNILGDPYPPEFLCTFLC